ncbi:M50 family metallopeptidase [Arcanobacterium hippocoleae]|uniref:M50 family metallopeptidase n=1 Tax=Arcanobacterium hippocoleae TaxID=149017 RepID=UPI00333F7304
MSIIGIILFILGLLIAVALHELGHLIPAKLFGVKVSQYFVGFGPTIFSKVYRGTEYGVKWILLGGYVRLCGMLAPARPGRKIFTKHGELTFAEQARRESAAELAPEEAAQAFWRLSPGKKLIVMFGGPFVNFLLSVLCFAIVWLGIGMPALSNTVGRIAPCIDPMQTKCELAAATPAARSELQQGDEIRAWAGTPVKDWQELREAIQAHGAGEKPVDVLREGRQETFTINVIEVERPQVRAGEIVKDTAGKPLLEMQPYLGVSPEIKREQQSFSALPAQIGNLALGTAQIIIGLPVHLWNIGVSLFSDTPRDASGVVGLVGIADMAGKITGGGSAQYTFAARAADFLLLFASLNMSLFIFNLLPLLPLDGGHILGALIEWIKRASAKWRGMPDPGAFDTARLLPLSQVVVSFFVLMTIFLIVADILKPAF